MPIMFPDFVTHSSVMIIEDKENIEPISAGFFSPETGKAFGESESLKMKSNPEVDSLILAMALLQYPVSEFIDMGYYEKEEEEPEPEGQTKTEVWQEEVRTNEKGQFYTPPTK